MEEYRNLSWRPKDPSELEVYFQKDFISEEVLANSLVNKYCEKKSSSTNVVNDDNDSDPELEKLFLDDPQVPGEMEYVDTDKKSRLGQDFHAKCVNAMRILQTNKHPASYTNFEKECITCFKNNAERIAQERSEYLQFVHHQWLSVDSNHLTFPYCLQTYAKLLWGKKMEKILEYPQYYKERKSFCMTFNDNENIVDFKFFGNVLKLGVSTKFSQPTLLGKCCLRAANLPPIYDPKNFYSSLPVSKDTNIDKLIQNGHIDIVISASSLKCLANTSEMKSSKWMIPVVVKNVRIERDSVVELKKIVYLDKPFSLYNPSTLDLSYMCYKRIIKKMFCQHELERYSTEDRIISDYQTTEIHPHVNYDLWNVKKVDCQNSLMKNRSKTIELNVLIRSKLIASELNDEKKIQPLIIRPKLELQVGYGANIASKSELAKEWVSLFFTPFSNLYRIRLSPKSGELITVEKSAIQNVAMEAQSHHNNYKPALCLGILQKVFEELHQLEPGKYLLQHLPRHEAFVTILKECGYELENEKSKNDIFDFHADHHNNPINVNTVVSKLSPAAWLPIDVNFLLPTFEYFHRIPGMFTPRTNLKRQQSKKQRKKKKKSNKKPRLP